MALTLAEINAIIDQVESMVSDSDNLDTIAGDVDTQDRIIEVTNDTVTIFNARADLPDMTSTAGCV